MLPTQVNHLCLIRSCVNEKARKHWFTWKSWIFFTIPIPEVFKYEWIATDFFLFIFFKIWVNAVVCVPSLHPALIVMQLCHMEQLFIFSLPKSKYTERFGRAAKEVCVLLRLIQMFVHRHHQQVQQSREWSER